MKCTACPAAVEEILYPSYGRFCPGHHHRARGRWRLRTICRCRTLLWSAPPPGPGSSPLRCATGLAWCLRLELYSAPGTGADCHPQRLHFGHSDRSPTVRWKLPGGPAVRRVLPTACSSGCGILPQVMHDGVIDLHAAQRGAGPAWKSTPLGLDAGRPPDDDRPWCNITAAARWGWKRWPRLIGEEAVTIEDVYRTVSDADRLFGAHAQGACDHPVRPAAIWG